MPPLIFDERARWRQHRRNTLRDAEARRRATNPKRAQELYAANRANASVNTRRRADALQDGFTIAHNATPEAFDTFRMLVRWYVADVRASRRVQWKLCETVDAMLVYGRVGDDVAGTPHTALANVLGVKDTSTRYRRIAMRFHVPILREFARIAGILRDWER